MTTNVIYRGHGPCAGGGLVTLERDGQQIGVLRHIVRHSPTGFGWGFGGSGPADLARSLLIDALGEAAKCPECAGTSRVVWLAQEDEPVPFDLEEHEHLVGVDTPTAWVADCHECDGDGWRILPYQAFKFEVVAALPAEGWTLSRDDVLAWIVEHDRKRSGS